MLVTQLSEQSGYPRPASARLARLEDGHFPRGLPGAAEGVGSTASRVAVQARERADGGTEGKKDQVCAGWRRTSEAPV